MSGGMVEISERVGGLVAAETALFEALGRLVPAAQGAAAVTLSTLSRHHAWRAEQLRGHLFAFGGYGAEDFVRLPAHLAPTLEALQGSDPISGVVVSADAALGALLSELDELRAMCTDVADGSLLRTVGMVEADILRDRAVLAGRDR